MRIEHFRSTKVLVLTGPGGEQVRIHKFIKRDGKNKQSDIGLEYPPGWRISFEPRPPRAAA